MHAVMVVQALLGRSSCHRFNQRKTVVNKQEFGMKKTEAVEIFGTQAALASAIGLAHSTVINWPDEIPRRHLKLVRLAIAEKAREMQAKAIELQDKYGA
jgi:DNA-binding XRE family transcriptional regulator